MARVKLGNVSKTFGKMEAVKNLSLEIQDKEFVCLLGPSGCGKTTTLRMIAGLETPTSGDILIDDKRVNSLSPKERDIAMVFQFYAIYPGMTVRDNLAFPLMQQKLPKTEIKERVEETARMLQIDGILEKRATSMTVGEKQRIAIGRALVRRPAVYLLDEPLSNLEAGIRESMRIELKKLHRDLGQTMIYVTHDQLEGISLADRIAIMDSGELQQYDTPSNIFDHPSNTFVAGFVGVPTMNFLDCRINETRSELDFGPFRLNVSKHQRTLQENVSESELVMGIRPSDITVEKVRPSENAVELRIGVIEPLGDEAILDVETDNISLKAIVPRAFHPEVGDKIWASFNTDKIHVFDKKRSVALL